MSKLSFRATLLLLLVLTITIWNALRLWTVLSWRSALTEFAGAGTTSVVLFSGAVWILVGLFSAWALSAQKRWAAKFLIFVAGAYSIWYWLARLLWQNARANWGFAATVNVLIFVFVVFVTYSLSREAYERENQHPKTE